MVLSRSNPVDFLVVGAAKSGTSTLFQTLGKHPGIFIPERKECRYFSCMPGNFVGPEPISANDIIQSFEEYQNLFNAAELGQLRGDISPDYLFYYQNAVPKILKEISTKVPIVIVLRNPIDRAYSNYLQKVRNRLETMIFEDALDAEAERRTANWAWGWSYVEGGLYAEQVKAYMDNFEQVLLLLFEEDIVTGRATDKVLNFLNLEPHQEGPGNVQANISGYPQNRLLHRLMTDKLVVGKIKNMIKATPVYDRSQQIYRKVMEANLRKEAMATGTRQMLKVVSRIFRTFFSGMIPILIHAAE